ncbi:MAG TPA: Hsp20/alpha crystallin family protein [Aquabacterium sp.]|nr:Hsp20/alpha crystallin family protein [Aquabacterium sp.]HQC96455.1 Hsp20/alpha crystallin family protein [Aquabacterium sp.]
MFLVPMTRQSADLARSFDRLFDESLFGAPSRAEAPATRSPALDVAETERSYTVKLDLPGAAKEDVKISIEGRRVTVEATTVRNDEKKDGERVLYAERSVASYARSFTLPVEVDQAESSAKMEHGVLTLQLAKRGATKASQLTVN